MDFYEFFDKKQKEVLSNKFPMTHQLALELCEIEMP